MIEKPIKKTDKRDKHIPQNFEQLIEMYDMEKLWPYILKLSNYVEETSVMAKHLIKVDSTQSATEEMVWMKRGKNLFNFYINSYKTGTHNASIDSINSSNRFVLRVSGDYARVGCTVSGLMPNTTYTISTAVSNGNGNTCGLYISSSVNDTRNSTSFTASLTGQSNANGEFYFEFYGNRTAISISNTVTFNNIQLEQGSAVTSYEEYIDRKILVKSENGVYEEFISKKEIDDAYNRPFFPAMKYVGGQNYIKIPISSLSTRLLILVESGGANITPSFAYVYIESTRTLMSKIGDTITSVSYSNAELTVNLANAYVRYTYMIIPNTDANM